MKKIFLLFPIFLLCFLSEAQDLKNYIPEDANYIVKVNGTRINKNVNFDEIRATDMYKDFIFRMLNNKTAEERAIFKLFETPDETGLNLKSEMYAYSFSQKNKKADDERIRTTTVFAIPLLNNKKFSVFIKDIYHKNSKAKIVKASKGVYFIKNHNTVVVWNTENVFICNLPYRSYYDGKGYSTSEIKTIIKSIAFPLASKSVVNNTKLLNGLGYEADISYIFNSNAWSQMPYLYDELNRNESIKDTTIINAELFKDNYSFSYITFDNGKIIFNGNQFYGKKLASIISPMFNVKPSPKLANILYQTPVTSYVSYAFSFPEVQKFVDRTFKYNMDTLLIDYVRSSQTNMFNTDSTVRAYNTELDSIDFLINGPEVEAEETDIAAITDSGTVYVEAPEEEDRYGYYYNSDKEKYEHETLNWFQLDSLETRRDTLYTMISTRKDTLAVKMYQALGIKGEEIWSIFKGDFLLLYHAMTTVEKKYKVYEMDEEFNYVEVEKNKKVPMPLYSFAASINSDSLFSKYLAILIQKGFIQKEKNRYLVVLGDMNQYIWVNQSICIITNDNNFDPNKRSNASKSDYEVTNYDRITGHQSGAYIEVGKILASSVQFVEDKQTAEVMEILAKYFDETIYTNAFDEQSNVTTKTDILFNEDKKNSINIMCDLMNEIYVHFTKK
jgi:hypothetical protein